MTQLWSMEEILAATGGRPVGQMPVGVSGVSIDSRTLKPGEAFFSISGERFDGHEFVSDAMKAGAGLAVVSERRLVALGHLRIPLLVVTDVLKALEDLGISARRRTRARIIAITGSVGKTSTKEMMRAALESAGKVHASPASFNNHWGVPLTLARMPAETKFGLFEIGMNHAGEIEPLAKMVRPAIAVITAIAPAHLGSFRSLNDIARAKAEIFQGLGRRGTAVIPRDSKYFKLLYQLAQESGVAAIRSFGRKRGADFRLAEACYGPDGSSARISICGKRTNLSLVQPGEHVMTNALAVLGVAKLAGAELGPCVEALARVEAGSGRGDRFSVKVAGGRATIIDESYNANPASMSAALKTLGVARPRGRGRRIAVLGDMLELGGSSEKLHKALKEPIIESACNLVYLGGPEMAALAGELNSRLLAGHFGDTVKLAAALIADLRGGDVVMVKASNGLNFSAIIEKLHAEGSAPKAEVS